MPLDQYGNELRMGAGGSAANGVGTLGSTQELDPNAGAFGAMASGSNVAAPAAGDAWTNLQTYLGLNGTTGEAMGNTVLGGIESAGKQAASTAAGIAKGNAGNIQEGNQPNGATQAQLTQMNNATDNANLLGSFGGQQALLGQQYGKDATQGYTAGDSALDAFLFGAANGRRINADESAYGGLGPTFGVGTAAGHPITQGYAGAFDGMGPYAGDRGPETEYNPKAAGGQGADPNRGPRNWE